MEATGCELAMTGHSTLVIVSVLLPTTSGRWSRASRRFRHPRIAGSFRRYSRIDKTKTQLCAAKPYPLEYRSRRSSPASEARVQEFRNESWSDLMEIKPSHKAFWAVTKALKTEDIPYTPTQKPDNSVAIDDAEIAECLADSIETQCSRFPSARHRSYQSHREQVLRLVEYVSEGFETEHSTVAVFFDVAKAFDRAGVPQGSTLSPLLYSAYTNDVPRPSSSGVQLALFADDTALFYGNRNRSTDSPSSPQRAIDELGQWFRKWRIEVNPTNQQPYNSSMVRLESTHCRQNTPNLKMLDAIIPWQRNYKYLVTLDKIYTSEIISAC
ncbi:Probable RNA-directed DNA polymerase from transposon BS [Eumeta japonica]|uniref:Probable RNA-directed DNA polymerase from transposon BS n=1 Tax=Eumeta variegata TaxID=151549 RepID=A0A4C1SWH9_EUMVA|nr:Probable RNA-directed DNA polymerase from transposon BS [Eumeta japonica]